MENPNDAVKRYLGAGTQGQFLSIANRADASQKLDADTTYKFVGAEQIAKLRKQEYKRGDTNYVSYDAIIRITLEGQRGYFLISARQLALEPVDYANADQQSENEPLLRWPECEGTLVLTLATSKSDPKKQYYSVAVNRTK